MRLSYEGRFPEHLCARVHANSPLIALRLDAISSLANLVQVPINPCPYYLLGAMTSIAAFWRGYSRIFVISYVDAV